MAIKNKIDFVCDQVINQKVFEGKYKEIIHSINEKIKTNEISSQKNLGFLHAKKNIQKSDYSKLQNILKFFNEEKIEVLVVIAPEYICLQSESIINLVDTHLKEDSDIDILFINESYSGIDVANLIKYLENKRFALNVISKNGDDFESLIIFRELISLLTNRVGRNNATKYIYVTTNNNYGRLFNWAQAKNYQHLVLLDNTNERFLNYSAAVLLPLACARINIDSYLEGANEANLFYENCPLGNNSAYKYALVRYIFSKLDRNTKQKDIFVNENICVFSQTHQKIGNLLAMYLNETSYRSYRGIKVNSFLQPSDTKTYTNIFFQKHQQMFDTHLIVKNPSFDFNVSIMDDSDLNDLNYLMKYSYNKLNKVMNKVIKNCHLINQIPFVEIIIDDLNHKTLGWIISFIHHAAIMSAYLMDLDPFEDNGLRAYNIELTKKFTELMGENKNE
ncbi:Glucose-6-phosphate isomerase (GPI) [Metamycoplasma alkalescens 14918]|uniref:Glucose-6-phosphate isomerase (GPI) n=2 Tax=Metamycoplasma alkalescens TaxID=45363 RepID=N9SR42_9BACT|nr:hypothetical protein [Metamycoplasma alkalescens]ENY53950.1 Glucose-6-phosphate isomerase (GPI) [Metamycoplasma alkalescens 14918]